MDNKFKYLDDTYLFEDETVISLIGNDERGSFLTFEHTIFHPQGGGQPSDIGTVQKGGVEVFIKSAVFVTGEIRHYFQSGDVQLKVGDKVLLKVDKVARLQNAKCHTAGHLIQAAVESLPVDLRAIKGYHYTEGAYVEFTGPIPANIESFIEEVNNLLKKMIQDGHQINTKMVTYNELKSLSGHVPEDLSPEKPLRVTMIEGLKNAVPCGGTHLKNTYEFQIVKIDKVKSKKGQVRISYTFN